MTSRRKADLGDEDFVEAEAVEADEGKVAEGAWVR